MLLEKAPSYDEEREHSMADEGGYAGALMEGEEPFSIARSTKTEKEKSKADETMSVQKEIRSWFETFVTLGLIAVAGYRAIRDLRQGLRKKNRPNLRIVPSQE